MIVGAILTQSAAWSNVEKAITNLKAARALSPKALRRLPLPEVATLIRPCGYYNAKALKLKSLAHWLGDSYKDDLDKLFANSIDDLRQQLLSVHGIGQETADSIILYGANKPIFVIDAYTRRLFKRLGEIDGSEHYEALRRLFERNLRTSTDRVQLFNEFHALIVIHAKDYCKTRPVCERCCLAKLCPGVS